MSSEYKVHKSPAGMTAVAVLEESYDARLPSDAPKYLSKTVIGHILQYFVIGILLGSMSSINGPIFATYFHMSSTQANLMKAFTPIVWSCKVGFGILTDCFPILGYRRKSWMFLGWSLCLASMLVLCFKDHGAPYVADATLLKAKRNLTMAERASIATRNEDAPTNGVAVAVICGVVTVFYVMAVVAGDAMVIELSMKEPDAKRGRLLSYIYGSRSLGSALAQIMIGSFLHSPVYGGSYAWGLSVNEFFAVLSAPVALMLPVVLFMLKEVHRPVVNCPQYLYEFWQMVQTRPFWRTMLYAFFFNLLTSVVQVTATPIVKYEWAGVTAQNNRWMTALGSLANIVGLVLASHAFNTRNWRWTIAVATVVCQSIRAFVDFATIYDVVRSEWLTLWSGVIAFVPAGVYFIGGCLVYLELAQEGKEGVTYGMLTTMANVGYVFTPFIGTFVTRAFAMDATTKAKFDTPEKRHAVAMPLVIGYACSLLACATVLFLPKQRQHLRFLTAYGGKQPVSAVLTLVLCFGCVLVTIVTSIMSVFPATQCLVVGGGTDC